jgi:hypothetical protein
MALVLKDRVKETTTTTGTGTVTLAGAAAGFQSFVVIGDGNQTFYAIVDATSGDWEVGVGAYTASGTTLSRATVVSSSNAGSLVNFGAGSKDVFVTYPSSRAVYLDAAGSAVSVLDIGTLGTSTANITTANITAGTVSTTPTSANDLVNKTYVDTLAASGIHFHQPVRVESPINLNATYNNGTAGVGATLTNAGTQAALVIDGVTVSVADRVLVYQQTTQTQNGIYVVSDVGSGSTNWILTRSSDADTYVINSAAGLSEGSTVFVQQGATGAGETYTCNTTGVITFGTTNITFAQISSAQIYSAGTGLTLSGTQFSITNTGTAGTYGSASNVPVIITNAQGQVTGVTPTAIAISGAAVSGNISGQAGSVANALTAGTFLTSGGTFDGSAARTFAVDATDANTASKVVARDASGNFSAGTITATLSGAATSATTATNLAGGAANRIAYQTSAGISNFITAPTASNQVLNWNGSAFTWSAGTISGVALGSNLNTLTFGTFLTGTSYNGSSAVTIATNATNANTASTIVARDASGNFSAGTITAALSGNATTSSSTSGNAATATALQTARTINGTSFNGTANITITAAANGGTATNLSGGTVSATTGSFSGAVTASSVYTRSAAGQGWLSGNYSSVETSATSGAIYSIGGAYVPTATTLGNMYGIGYTIGSVTGQSGVPADWGMYVAAGGVSRIFLCGGDGTIRATGAITASNITAAGNVTGNAATATTLASGQSNWSGTGVLGNVVGLMAWKNYANGHVIFDASASTSPSGGAVNNTNAAVAWSSTYPTLMGWNGSSTYGVRVDSARTSDNTTGSSASCTGNAATATRATRSNGFFYIDDNYGLSTVGLYASTIFQGWFAMGDAYKTTAGGAISNLYGVTWSYPSAGGIAGNLDSHGLIVAINGGFGSCLSYNVKASGNVTAYSDERLKKNWEPLCNNFVEKLAKVKVGTYERTDLPMVQVGVSAQSLEEVLPEAVSTATDDMKTKSVSYGNAALASAVMLAQEVVELKQMMKQLQAELAELKRGA